MNKRSIIVFTFGLLLAVSLSGCGAKNNSLGNNNMVTGSTMDSLNSEFSNSISSVSSQGKSTSQTKSKDTSESTVQANSNNTQPVKSDAEQKPINNHKIIQTGQISMESLKFEESVSKTIAYIESVGGYAEDSNVQGQGIDYKNNARKRTANFVFRVPSNKYKDLFTQMRGYGVVTSEQSKGEDVTEKYLDTEARLKSLKIQEERELELLQKATKLSDILELEKELNGVRYQIETYTGTLRKWDSLVDYSTVRLTIVEVEESKITTPTKTQGLWARVAYSFTESTKNLVRIAENLIITVVALLPFALVLSVIIALITLIRKHIIKIRKK